MPDTPTYKYTVVIPTRNRQECAMSAIKSVLLASSNRSDIQIIVLDNSDDAERLPTYMKTDLISSEFDRVKFVASPDKPISMQDNWERGIPLFDGEWLTYIGDDDGVLLDGFEVLDWMTETLDMKGFVWRPVYYKWPSFPAADRDVLTLYTGDNILGAGNCEQILKTHVNWSTTDKWPGCGPGVYHGCIHHSIIDKVCDKHGRYFLSHIVDYSSAMANCTFMDNFVQYTTPVTVMGASGDSNTAGLTNSGSGKLKIDHVLDENPGMMNRFPFKGLEGSRLHVPTVVVGYQITLEALGRPFYITPALVLKSCCMELARVRDEEIFKEEHERLAKFAYEYGLDMPNNLTFTDSKKLVGIRKEPPEFRVDVGSLGMESVTDVVMNMIAFKPRFKPDEKIMADVKERQPNLLRSCATS